jgi:hypothetical protein
MFIPKLTSHLVANINSLFNVRFNTLKLDGSRNDIIRKLHLTNVWTTEDPGIPQRIIWLSAKKNIFKNKNNISNCIFCDNFDLI